MSDEKNKVDTTTEIKNSEMKKAEIKKADANVKTMEDFTSPEILYDELIASVKKYHPSTDISMIEKAYKIAYEAHEGQKRKSGEPYIIHPLSLQTGAVIFFRSYCYSHQSYSQDQNWLSRD